jgi:hypothetical protein
VFSFSPNALSCEQEDRSEQQASADSIAPDPTKYGSIASRSLHWNNVSRLWEAFPKVVSRELPFAVVKFIAFDFSANSIIALLNFAQIPILSGQQIQVGSGTIGLIVSAIAGAMAGIAGAVVSHPADLILTLTASSSAAKNEPVAQHDNQSSTGSTTGATINSTEDWLSLVQELLNKEGGIANLFVGLPTRALFFALVIGLQFWLYDYVKILLQVGSDDLLLVLDVFYAIGKSLIGGSGT